MLATDQTSYDRVLYPSNPFAHTHPDHLATIASLHGMTPAPVSGSRVLELGCGSGGNLMPMACQLPDSQFLGIDLSQRAIENGNAMIAQLGLTNVTLQHRDIMDLSAADGQFDYIIAHGVYSWVPQAVRDKILSIFKHNLSPQGVAFVSYNAYPGAHLRNLARSMMLFHVRRATDPQERIAQSRGLMKLLAEAGRQDEIYGILLRDQFERIKSVPDEVLIHDDLDEGSAAFFLYQVAEAAARQGLQYLADAEFPDPRLFGCSPQVNAMLSQIPEDEVVAREQYFDFVDGRAFRNGLFCHHDVPLRRAMTPQCVKDYYLSTDIVPADEDPAAPGAVAFKSRGGPTLQTDHLLSKAALVALGRIRPQAITFPDLVQRALSLLGAAAPARGAALDSQVEAMTDILFQAFRAGLVQLHREPLRLTTSISNRPQASRYARWQAGQGPLVTNLIHSCVMLEDEVARQFVLLLDGTRDLEQLGADLRAAVAEGSKNAELLNPTGAEVRKAVHDNLEKLAKCALLVA